MIGILKLIFKKKEKIYISGAITGVKDYNRKKFSEAENLYKVLGYKVINPLKLHKKLDMEWEYYMKKDIRALTRCSTIYMLDDWKKSEGAILEHHIARKLRLRIIYQ